MPVSKIPSFSPRWLLLFGLVFGLWCFIALVNIKEINIWAFVLKYFHLKQAAAVTFSTKHLIRAKPLKNCQEVLGTHKPKDCFKCPWEQIPWKSELEIMPRTTKRRSSSAIYKCLSQPAHCNTTKTACQEWWNSLHRWVWTDRFPHHIVLAHAEFASRTAP